MPTSVFYQKPVGPRKYPLTFLHGAGQVSKTWETTPDGREGIQTIFLRRNFSVYVLDQPRRGDAGRSTVAMNVGNTHFPFSDLNNVEVADHLAAWLKEKKLDQAF